MIESLEFAIPGTVTTILPWAIIGYRWFGNGSIFVAVCFMAVAALIGLWQWSSLWGKGLVVGVDVSLFAPAVQMAITALNIALVPR